ncbi:helix-turn-helix transcriptional regulator [Fodinibius saliphilus]|uniref:helix-turn-helix transcriptional regulator n=1 Tax=Fodinibius saliphilus TaxID=1920650 RepID=UPI0011082388|nr:AraC family transcriptional regulator [Fodinibius saliphilus]
MDDSHQIVREILSEYQYSLPSTKPDWPKKISRAAQYINEHIYDQSLTVKQITGQCFLNGYNFSENFRHFLQLSPINYITTHRLESAKRLLKDHRLKQVPIVSISMHVGFKSNSAFTTTFKNKIGIPPSVWRKENMAST